MTPRIGAPALLHTENGDKLPGVIAEVFDDGTVAIELEIGAKPHVPFVDDEAATNCANYCTSQN